MVNSELKSNGPDNSGTGMRTFHKQSPITTKKMVLTDVQNEGRPIADTIKVCGTKRLTPECPSTHSFHPTLTKPTAKEHLMDTRKKFEFEPEKGRIQNNTNKYVSNPQLRHFCNVQQEISRKQTHMREGNTHCVPAVSQNHMAPKMTLSYASPSLPSSLGKPGNGVRAAEHDYLKVSSEVPRFTSSKRDDDQKWEERFIHLQNFLKICDDESNHRDHIQKLRHLSPAELSIYAVELEKIAIQLTIEEGKEWQRMKTLNILGKSATTIKTPHHSSQPPPSKK